MGLTNQIQQWYIKTFPGMNNKMEDLDKQDKWVDSAQNCRFEPEPGAVTKREPIAKFNSASLGSGPVMGAKRFYSSSGATKFVVVYGSQAFVGSDTDGTFTAIRNNLTESKRMVFEVYRDLLICSNGYDDIFVYDGSDDNLTWELGACKAKTGTGTGITATSITYQITYDGDAFIPGALSNVISSVTNKNILLSHIPLAPSGATNRKIFRKDSNTSNTYKLVTTITDPAQTTFTDDVVSGSLGAAIGAVNDDMPKGTILKVYRERMFVSGDLNSPNRIYFSNPYLPHYIQQTTNIDYMLISPEDGDEIMGIPVQLGVMVCIKKNTIRKVQVTTPTSGADPNTWYSGDPVSFKGAASQWSITETSYGVVFLGWDHWYLFDGSSVQPIIDEFDSADILPSAYSETVGFINEDIFLAAYSDNETAPQNHNRVMRWNFKRQALSVDTLDVNCFTAKTGDDERGELYYGSSVSGWFWKEQYEDSLYKLTTKPQAQLGTSSTVFIGGLENSPYIEIGEDQAPIEIPDNVCILWDYSDPPGSGWTEITDKNDKFILISTANALSIGTTGVSGTTFTSLSYLKFRCFYKNPTTTEYDFPVNSIIFFDQNFAPGGWMQMNTEGKYLMINSAGDGEVTEYVTIGSASSGSSGAINIDNSVSLNLIKKLGDPDSWDGLSQYGYCLYAEDTISDAEFTDITSTYSNRHIKTSKSSPATTNGGDTLGGADFVQSADVISRDETVTGRTQDQSGTWSTATPTLNGEFTDAYDRDTSDYREAYLENSGDGRAEISSFVHEHVWETAREIDVVTVKVSHMATGGNYFTISFTGSVSLKINGSWTSVGTHSFSTANYNEEKVYNYSLSTGWSGVTGIRVTLFSQAYSYEGTRMQKVWARIYDVRAEGYLDHVCFRLVKKILGKVSTWNKAILTQYTGGTWTSPSMQINANSFKGLYWNEDINGNNDDVVFYTRTGATQATCEAAAWSAALSNPNGSIIASTADVWYQYKIEFSAPDSRATNPRVYFIDGYVVKQIYSKGFSYAETSVNFIYRIGFRNFDQPMADKIFQKLSLWLEGSTGSVTVNWETEHAYGTFTIDLATLYGRRWDTFFQSDAMGREISIEIVKNDMNPLKIKELMGLYQPQPIIV